MICKRLRKLKVAGVHFFLIVLLYWRRAGVNAVLSMIFLTGGVAQQMSV